MRAKWLISNFEEHATAWLNDNPAIMRHTTDPATGLETATLVVNAQVPANMSLFVGECLHHLRGALDHATHAIVSFIAGKEDRNTNFPFHKTEREFKAMRSHADPTKHHRLFKLAPDIWNEIEGNIKPWAEPNGNLLLWSISALNNADKHRLILTTTLQTTANADLGRIGYYGNLAILIGPGEMCVGRGLNLAIEQPRPSQIVIHERDIMPDVDMFAYVKDAHDLVFQIVEKLEFMFFAQKPQP